MRAILATDGSIESDIARAVVEKLPLPPRTTLTAAMAVPIPVESGVALAGFAGGRGGFWPQDAAPDLAKIARQTVDRVAEDLKARGFKAEGVVLEGDAGSRLLELAASEDAELIATGSGASSNFAAFFLGSVSRRLVTYSETSLLIGRKYADERQEESCRFLKEKERLDVVVAYDGSEGSELAIRSFAGLRRPAFGTITVVCVDPLPYVGSLDPTFYASSLSQDGKATEGLARRAASRLAAAALQVDAIGTYGRPSTEIVRIAKEKKADLVVVGANRLGAIERLLLGSCAYEAATSAPCSVLVLRDVLPFTNPPL